MNLDISRYIDIVIQGLVKTITLIGDVAFLSPRSFVK